MSVLRRLTIVAVLCWLLWTLLAMLAAPNEPSGGLQVVFVVSMVLALAGSIWACWHALAQHGDTAWRRSATIALGLGAFALILFVGHAIGVGLASTLSS